MLHGINALVMFGDDLGLWVFGSLGLWVFGSLGLWVFGSLGLWVFMENGENFLYGGIYVSTSPTKTDHPVAASPAFVRVMCAAWLGVSGFA